MTRILVTGSRDWADEQTVIEALDCAQARYRKRERNPDKRPPTLVVGDCPTGADEIARRVWVKWFGPRAVDRHRADWSTLGKGAGFARNAEMVKSGVDLCLAFIGLCRKPDCPSGPVPHDSHGTAHCVSEARHAGVEVREFRP